MDTDDSSESEWDSDCSTAQPDVAQPAVPEGHQLQHLPGKQERDCVVCSDRSRGIRKRSSYW